MKDYLRNRFYWRGTTPLGAINTLLAFLFNRVIVRVTDQETGQVVGGFLAKGTDFPRA